MRITQSLDRRLPYGDYPDPIASQEWHARQTIDYLHSSDLAILDLASRYRREFLTNIWTMARNSIERGSQDHWTVTPKLMALARAKQQASPANASGRRGGGGRGRRGAAASNPAVDAVFTAPELRDARAYVMPRDQLDPAAVTRFLRALRRNGIDVLVAESAFQAGGKSYAAGSYVVKADQAFRPHLRDMFEPQYHPDDLGTGGEPVRPYDSAGWTLTMQMGVQTDKILDAVDGEFRTVDEIELAFQPREASRGRAGYLISHGNSNSFIAGNRLLKAGEKVYWLNHSIDQEGVKYPAGTVYVAAASQTYARVDAMAKELGIEFHGVDKAPTGSALQLELPRIGLFDVYGGNMPTGWTQWILKQFEFPVELVFGKQVAAGNLHEKYDVLMFLTGLPRAAGSGGNISAFRRFRQRQPMTDEVLEKIKNAMPPFEDWSNLADRRVALTAQNAIPNLEAFVADGGTLIAIGNSATSAISSFDLPVEVGPFVTDENGDQRQARSSEFFIPGSLVWTDVDTSNPVGYGSPARLATMFRRSPVLMTQNSASSPVTYADRDQLASGWAIGQELLKGGSVVVGAKKGSGQILLYGADVLYRGQPLASFKLVFNGIMAGVATSVNL